jgi:hypothetical protein
MAAIERWGDTTVLVVGDADGVVEGRTARDLMADAFATDASLVVLPVDRLEGAFFDLRSGVAGDLLQASVTYRMPLAIAGELPEPAASSAAFAALVRESNAGSQHWFLPSIAAVRARVERPSG